AAPGGEPARVSSTEHARGTLGRSRERLVMREAERPPAFELPPDPVRLEVQRRPDVGGDRERQADRAELRRFPLEAGHLATRAFLRERAARRLGHEAALRRLEERV